MVRQKKTGDEEKPRKPRLRSTQVTRLACSKRSAKSTESIKPETAKCNTLYFVPHIERSSRRILLVFSSNSPLRFSALQHGLDSPS